MEIYSEHGCGHDIAKIIIKPAMTLAQHTDKNLASPGELFRIV